MNLEYLESIYFKPIKGVDKATAADVALADKYLNISYKQLFLAHNWIQRKRYGQIVLIPKYTTGTVTVTAYNGSNEAASKTLTFAGATLTTDMIGRHIRFNAGDKWYRIMYLSGNTAYIDSPVTDVASGSISFEIWKRFYYLKSDVAEFIDFGRWTNGRLEYNSDLLDRYTDLSRESDSPSSYDIIGTDFRSDVSDDATIEISLNTNLGTVSSLNMLSAGYDTGDIAEIGGVMYYIRRIESDTRVVFFNYFQDAIAAGTSVTFRKNEPIGFEFYNPPDDYFAVPYVYLGRAYDLIHKTLDRILLPNNFIEAIISKAHYYAMKDASDTRYANMLNIYTAQLDGLKAKSPIIKPRFRKFSPQIINLAYGRGQT